MIRASSTAGCIALLSLCLASGAQALEYPIGTPHNVAGMEIAAVYLQPIDMEPAGHMRAAADSDIHIEADIHALDSNTNGFAEGAWIPFLKSATRSRRSARAMRPGASSWRWSRATARTTATTSSSRAPGKYKVKYTISPPNAPDNPLAHHFGRHTDRATGVRPWFKPFDRRMGVHLRRHRQEGRVLR